MWFSLMTHFLSDYKLFKLLLYLKPVRVLFIQIYYHYNRYGLLVRVGR